MEDARDFSLLPKMEEWGSGDEAIDRKLDLALRKTIVDLSFQAISEFYFLGVSLKPRVHNPSFTVTIELVTKALLYFFSPQEFNNHLFIKLKGCFNEKKTINFQWDLKDKIILNLKQNGKYRHAEELDFYLHKEAPNERNPFVRYPLLKSPYDLHTKIVFKEFKKYLSGEKDELIHSDPFFRAIRLGNSALLIEGLGIFWYHKDQIFSISFI